MQSRIKRIERLLRSSGIEESLRPVRCFYGDGEHWRETVFDHSNNLAAVVWEQLEQWLPPPPFTESDLLEMEAQGVKVIRARYPVTTLE